MGAASFVAQLKWKFTAMASVLLGIGLVLLLLAAWRSEREKESTVDSVFGTLFTLVGLAAFFLVWFVFVAVRGSLAAKANL